MRPYVTHVEDSPRVGVISQIQLSRFRVDVVDVVMFCPHFGKGMMADRTAIIRTDTRHRSLQQVMPFHSRRKVMRIPMAQ